MLSLFKLLNTLTLIKYFTIVGKFQKLVIFWNNKITFELHLVSIKSINRS